MTRFRSMQVLVPCFAGIALSACGGSPVATSIDAPLTVNMANDRFEITTPAQMCGTLLVSEGIVSAYSAGHWNTADGTRPPKLNEVALVRGGYTILTPFQIVRMTADHDRRKTATLEYVTAGGTVGQDSWHDSAFPHPVVGRQEVMVFVPTQVPGGSFTQQSLTLYEAFPIDSSNMVTLQPQTIEQGHVSQTEVKISLTELRSDLERCA